MQGADQVAKQVSATGAMLEGAVLKAGHKLLTGDTLTDEDVAQMGLLNALDKRIDQGAEKNQAYFQPEYDKGGKIGQAVGKYGAATVAALPQAALAFVTAGQSLAAAQSTAGLQAASSAAGAGIAQTVNTLLKDTATDPGFLYSLVSTMGGEYQQAKADGADDAHAYAYAALTGVLNSLVEVGGGIDQLPDGSKKAVRQWVATMLDEGKEEVIQGAISQLAQNAVYGKGNALASATDEDAVLSAKRAVEEFIGGAVVGGILGGGQIAIQSGVNRMYDRARAQTRTDTEPAQTAREETGSPSVPLNQTAPSSVGAVETETQQTGSDSLLRRATEEAAQKGRVTNSTAVEILSDPDTMSALAQEAGLNVREGMSKSQQREAVKSAVDTLAQRQRAAETLEGYPTLQQLERGEPVADANTAALEAMDAMEKGIISRERGRELVRQAAEAARSQAQQPGQAQQTLQRQTETAGKGAVDTQADQAEQTSSSAEQSTSSAESREPGFYGTADKADAQYLDRLAKAAGVTMEQVSSQEAGQRQGWAIDGRIYLSEQTEDPLRMVARHEITHRIQEMAADSYSEYRGYVEEVYRQEGTLDESIRMRQELYRKNGQELTYDQALDELAADYAGELLVNEQLIDRLAQGKPSLARRVLDAIKDVLSRLKQKLSRSEVEPLEQAARLWEQALRDANRAYYQDGQRTESGEVRNLFAGELARTADEEMLKRANALEEQGADPESIRQETGWFRGADGRWRFEIDDSRMEYRKNGDARLLEEPDYKRLEELTQKWVDQYEKNGPELTEAELNEMDALQEQYSDRVWEEKYMLRDFLRHEELFEAYPRLKGVSLAFDTLEDGARGYFDRRSNTIVLSDNLIGAAENTLVHEVQHVIQKVEGFSGGSSIDYWNRKMEDGYSRKWDSGEEMMPSELYRNTAGEIEARDAAARRKLTAEERRAKAPDTGDENTVFAEDGGASYSIRKTADGTEIYETSEDVRKMPYKQCMETFLDIMRNEYRGRTAKFSANNDVYYAKFDEADLRKNVYGDKKSSPRGWKAKINTGADGNIFELIENAQYSRSGTERGKNTEAHQNLTGWEYFVKTVQIDGHIYDLLANVRKKPDGEYVYSIQLNERKNKASAPPRQYQNDTAKAENRPVGVPTDATDTVPQGKKSVKGTRALQKQVEALTRQNQRLKEQLKRTDTVKASRKAVEQQAGELKKAYQSKIGRAALADRMDSLYTKMGQLGSQMEGGAIVTEEDIRAEARGIAEDILTESRANVNPKAEEYADLRKELRGRRLYLAEEYRADLDAAGGYTEFRRRNMGSLTLSTKGTAVDVAYQELSDRYPNLFPDDIYHPADQLVQIGEVAQDLKQVEGNPYEQELEYTTQYLAGELMERFYDTPSAKPTLADKMERRYQSQRLKDQQANRQRLEKQQTEYKQRLEEMEDSYREKNRKRIESQNASQRRETIRRHAERLGRKLVRPTDTQHVPENFRGAALAFVKYLDLGSSYEMAYGTDGKYHRVEIGSELGAEPTSRTLAATQLQKEYAKLEEAGYAVDPMMEAYLEEIGKLGNKRVADMSRSELDTVWTVMQVLEHAISKENDRLGESRYRTVSDLAETLRRDNGQKEDRGSYAGLKGKADDLLNLNMLEPVTFFSRMGEAGEDIYRQMRKAADRQTEIIREGTDRARQLVEDNDISFKKLDGELHTFDLTDGKLTLSTSQLMELYALSKREQAQEHIYLGGLKPRNAVDKKGKIVENSRAVHVTPVEVAEMLDTLTAEQKSLMDGLQGYLSGDLAGHGNRESVAVYGYEKFKEKNYWPIKVSGNETQSDAGSKAKAKTIPGYGMTKTTQPHAKNAVELRSALDSFCTHLNQMSTYAAWLNTNENLTRLENYQFQDGNGNADGTMKGLLEKVYGQGGQTYYENLLQDIAQGTKAGADPSLTGKMMSNWKAAKVGANLRVVIQQPTAVLRAMSMVDPKYFAVAQNPMKGWAEAKEHCPIAQWKDWGYFETGAGRSLRELVTGSESALDWTRNASGAWAGGEDAVGWGHLWNAVKAEVTAENKALTVKSEAWWQAVSDRFSEVVDKTQVVDSVMHRSQIMRSSDGATKKITAFQSEPTKIYNMVLRDIYAAKSADGKAARQATAKAIRRDVAALVTSFAVNAAAQSFMDAMRDDDRDKEFGEKFWDNYLGRSDKDAGRLEKAMGVIGGNFVSNFNLLTYIPIAKEMWSVAEGYTLGSSDLEGLEDAVLGVKAVIDKAQGKGQESWLYTGLDAACKAADLVGLPASNLRRDAGAIFRTAMQSAGAGNLLYEWDKLKYDPETAMGIYQNDLYRAMDSDWDLYEKIYGELQAEQVKQLRKEAEAEGETPTDEELEAQAAQKTKTAMENRMKKELGISSTENLPYRYSAPGENEAFDSYLKEQIKSQSDWIDLPEEVEGLVRELEDQEPEKTERVLMIADSGMEEGWKESFLRGTLSSSEWERYDYCKDEGVTIQEWADAYNAIGGAHYQRTGKRGSATKTDVETALSKLKGLTNKKRTAIWNSYVETGVWKSESPWG